MHFAICMHFLSLDHAILLVLNDVLSLFLYLVMTLFQDEIKKNAKKHKMGSGSIYNAQQNVIANHPFLQ